MDGAVTKRSEEPEASLAGARVLVTGGAGFIGSHVVDQLVRAGCGEVIVLDNFVRATRDNLAWAQAKGRVTLVEADIRRHDVIDKMVRRSDFVFHQAAIRNSYCAVDPRQAFEVMVEATFDLIQMCVAHNVRRLVMASSALIYGIAEELPTTEQYPPYRDHSLYGAAKLFAEGLLRAFNDMAGLSYMALRYFDVYGPRMDMYDESTGILIRWMERIEAGLPPLVFGAGGETMDLVHVGDVARANILAATAPKSDIAVNIGSGREVDLQSLALRLARVMGRGDLIPEQPPFGGTSGPRRHADIAAARRWLNFRPATGLDEGLLDLVSWWRRECRQIATPAGAL